MIDSLFATILATLEDLLPYVTRRPEFDRICQERSARLEGVSAAAALVVAASVVEPWLLVVPDVATARKAVLDLGAYGAEAAFFPPVELSAYQGVSPDPDLVSHRQEVLAGLARGDLKRVVTTIGALAGRVPSPEAWRQAIVRLEVGQILGPTTLTQILVQLGLKPATAVTERGEFSRRGGILDLWPLQAAEPLRIEWFDDTIETLRRFDPTTQRSLDGAAAAEIWPAREILLPGAQWGEVAAEIRSVAARQAAQFRAWGHRAEAERLVAIVADQTDKLGQFQPFEGCEVYAPFCHEMSLFLDHLPAGTRVLRYDPEGSRGRLTDHLASEETERKAKVQAGLILDGPVGLLATTEEIEARLASFATIDLCPGEPDLQGAEPGTDPLFWWSPPVPAMPNRFADLAEALARRSRSGERVIIASAQPQRVFALLDEHNCHATVGAKLPPPAAADRYYGGVWIFREALGAGFEWPALGISVFSDHEIFGWQKRSARTKKVPFAGTPVTNVAELKPGDCVVHHKHGIGRYHGLKRLVVDGQEKEYLQVTYQGDDRLYVPVDQIGLLFRYRGGGEVAPKLSKMGGAEWDSVKNRVRKAIQALAEDLIALYARRMALPGHAFGPDTDWQRDLEDAFAYQETVDQLRAIEETKADLEQPRPMDRLICGDVGFGKTEVAIRAAFKAAVGGKQVAILAPTTLLAQQHFQVFRERFAPFPLRVALLSRFRTAAQQRETLRGLGLGEVDVVVGTHRLLSKDVKFKDLGLMVIDEEHRFGVGHKERLKAMKTQVDVLSMSATPIPRTLYLALSGARDMSLITTPPSNRLPVKTTVGPWDPEVARTAILRELERGGQVFFLHNRVEDLERWVATVVELVPQARVAMAHGQMDESALEDIMLAFVGREFDVLVTTTIIESGLDIPAANTILIHDADKLGLAQLYQLRGRVGRADVKAYCYCMYAPGKELTDEARDRLAAISQHTALGSGYQIALRDMEIRGVGNILGPEQHGQVMAVGYDTYMQLLEEAVAAGLGQEVTPHAEATVDLPVTAYLPDDWFASPETRAGSTAQSGASPSAPSEGEVALGDALSDKMVQYRRLAGVASLRELELLTEDWRDRYGPPPPAVRNLLRMVGVKLKATDLHIASIKSERGKVRVALALARSAWAEIQLANPVLSRWQWAEAELALDRSKLAAEEQLKAVEKLLDALSTPVRVTA